MNNKQLQYALALSKSLNFSAVASELGISQPALSKQISGLEKELGILLFDRTSMPITLTAAGEHFFKNAEELLFREQQLFLSMEDFKSGKNGRLTIGISPFRSLYLLPHVCKAVKQKYPGIKIVLSEEVSDNLRRYAAEGKYDFAIANLPVDESSLDVLPIENDTLVLVVPKSMLDMIDRPADSQCQKISFTNCKRLPFIVIRQTQEMRALFERICASCDFTPNIAMEVVGLSTAWAMARAGIGATLLPLQFVENMNSETDLALFPLNHEINTRTPAIITKRGQYLPEYARYAIALLSGKEKI